MAQTDGRRFPEVEAATATARRAAWRKNLLPLQHLPTPTPVPSLAPSTSPRFKGCRPSSNPSCAIHCWSRPTAPGASSFARADPRAGPYCTSGWPAPPVRSHVLGRHDRWPDQPHLHLISLLLQLQSRARVQIVRQVTELAIPLPLPPEGLPWATNRLASWS
jgi:hypothetical protein